MQKWRYEHDMRGGEMELAKACTGCMSWPACAAHVCHIASWRGSAVGARAYAA